MPVGADGVLTNGNSANSGDFPRHFAPGQNATFAGFGTLAEFEFEHPDLVVRGNFAQLVIAEITHCIPDTVLGCADLENNVGTALEVVRGQPPFAGIDPAARLVHGKEILAEEFAQFFEKIAKAANDRIIAAKSVLCLADINDIHHDDGHGTEADEKDKESCQKFQ
jgi:hypothetical protein